MDLDTDFTGESGRDGPTYRHYLVYNGFLISYNNSVNDRIAPDIGRGWPAFLRNAQALIDRRFPPVKPVAPAAAPASSGGAAHHSPPPATSPANSGGPSLSQAQLDAARNALARISNGAAHSPPGSVNTPASVPRVAGGGSTTKPPAADHRREAAVPKPEDKKKHPLAGTWRLIGVTNNLAKGVENGVSGQIVITVEGRSMHVMMTTNLGALGSYVGTGNGTVAGSDQGPHAIQLTVTGPGGSAERTSTFTLSADHSTIVMDGGQAGAATSWQRIK